MKFDESVVRQRIRNRLIKCRKEAGLTQTEVGNAVGKSTNAVGSWEQGYSLPDLETFLKLTKLYDKPIAYMFNIESDD